MNNQPLHQGPGDQERVQVGPDPADLTAAPVGVGPSGQDPTTLEDSSSEAEDAPHVPSSAAHVVLVPHDLPECDQLASVLERLYPTSNVVFADPVDMIDVHPIESLTILIDGPDDASRWTRTISRAHSAGCEVCEWRPPEGLRWKDVALRASQGEFDVADTALDRDLAGREHRLRFVEPQSADDDPDLGLLRRSREPPPSFPLEILGALAEPIARTARARGAPVDYTALALLAVAASLIGTTRRSAARSFREPAILWMMMIGAPSTGKSPATDPIIEPLRSLEAELAQDYREHERQWEADRRAAVIRERAWEENIKKATEAGHSPPPRPLDAVPPEPPVRPRLRFADYSTESLASMLSQRPRGVFVFRDEAAGLIGALDRYGGKGSDRAFLLECYGGRSFVVDRMSRERPTVLPYAAASILGGIQPDRLRSLVLSGDDDGLAARFVFAWPDPAPFARLQPAPDGSFLLSVFRRLHALEHARHDGRLIPRDLELTPEALEYFESWRERHYQETLGEAGLYGSALGKYPGLVLRLSVVLELLAWAADIGGKPDPSTISAATIIRATTFLDVYAKPMLRRALGEAKMPTVECDAVRLATQIVRHRPERINARDIRHQRWLPEDVDCWAASRIGKPIRKAADASRAKQAEAPVC